MAESRAASLRVSMIEKSGFFGSTGRCATSASRCASMAFTRAALYSSACADAVLMTDCTKGYSCILQILFVWIL